ncbi:MAG: histidine phosphatase family protein [Candidatus Muiribacteriaceae bacterium]
MKFWVARHGKYDTCHPEHDINALGEADTYSVCEKIGNEADGIKVIYHSGMKRAKSTAAIFSEVFAVDDVRILPESLPDDSEKSLLDVVEKGEGDFIFVGHLPFLRRFLGNILHPSQQSMIFDIPTSCVFMIEKKDGAFFIQMRYC